MKKIIRNSMAIMALASIVTFTSCDSKKDDDNPDTPSFVVDHNDFKGKITSTVTLDASKEYKLTGSVVVENGAKLIIPAGTKIVGTGGTSSYIAVAQGGQIEINGTATNPVVMTALEKKPGAWGGLVICGKAPINSGATATAEVSDLTYGGNVADDNSGVIKYLRIEYSGANFNSEKEFNGLSLFGVGSGTTVEYVQLHKGSDDGIEFFGGTVNANYIVSSHNEDDLFDWTEGWTGKGENWYGVQIATAGDRGLECDNNSKNHTATPISNPTLKNITLVGGDVANDVQAVKLRVGTHVSIDNIVLKNWKTGFNIEHDETIAAIESGKLSAKNVKFDNVNKKSKGKNTAGESVDVSAFYQENEAATGAGNGGDVPTWTKGWTVGL